MMMKPTGRYLLLTALFLPAAFAQQSAAPGRLLDRLHLSTAVNVTAINNLSRTSDPATRKDATTYEIDLASTHARQLAPSILLIATGEATALTVPDHDLTNHLRFTGRFSLQHKFGLGPQAPVLQFNAGTAYKASRFDGDRGWTTEGGVQLAKRVLPNLRLAAGTTWLQHAARSATFDLNQHSYTFDTQWDITDRWTLSGSAGRLSGDFVTHAASPVWATMLAGGFGPEILAYYTARPWSTTHLYGPGWVSYNIKADVDLWSVSLGYALSDHTALELRKSGAYVVNRVGVTYPTDSWSLGLSHRF